MTEFEGKTVLITGCARARGMGRAIAGAFARAGADIVATDVAAGGTRNENEEGVEEIRLGWKGLESLAGEIEGLGRRVLTLVGDVSHAADTERMVGEALARFGHIDVLVNNAAAPHGADRRLLWEVPEEAWDAVLGVNLKGTFLVCRGFARAMAAAGTGGSIIVTASTNSFLAEPDSAHYNASKGGAVMLVKSMAVDLAKAGIRVNAVAPGTIRTNINAAVQSLPDGGSPLFAFPPARRWGDPADLAGPITFLASADAAYITGSVLVVDGGQISLNGVVQ